jgi:hypothetical protein
VIRVREDLPAIGQHDVVDRSTRVRSRGRRQYL